ncbi:cytosine deaminase [Glutamicibacter uratoxydans]|uniref:Cytosine deaminase n=1 Tax=Glutamicibacter uratoxydans TaxID=43667 RepID=A0A4Y4DTW9_GLUUR|nr:amidohydrolase family protein [Glutamicibacter uratoxydans]GED05931.1 cytosine deaminase [Glutamicibacter uratoxydans]
MSQPLIVPGFVNAHVHPDKTSFGSTWLHRKPAHSLKDLISNDLETQLAYADSVETRMGALVQDAIASGVTAMRAHVDFGPQIGLKNIHGAAAVAEKYKEMIDIQIVAFPQFGLLSNPGAVDLLEAALGEGAQLVGGIDPEGLEQDLHGHLDVVFGLAEKYGRRADIHVHDTGEVGYREIQEIARRTQALGMNGQVTIGHAFALADAPSAELERTLDAVAEAGIWIATCALGSDPVPDLDLLAKHGVNVDLGTDGVRDAWSPFGTASMMDRAHLLAYRTNAITDEQLERCLDIATIEGAKMMGIDRVLNPVQGDGAYFEAEHRAQLVVDRPAAYQVVRGGVQIAANGRLS